LFVIPCRWVVENFSLQFADAAAARKNLERLAGEARVRHHFHQDIDDRADPAEEDDDEEPVKIWAAADEVDDGDRFQQKAPPRREKKEQGSHSLAEYNTAV